MTLKKSITKQQDPSPQPKQKARPKLKPAQATFGAALVYRETVSAEKAARMQAAGFRPVERTAAGDVVMGATVEVFKRWAANNERA